jgi:type IV secretion system protein TrbL
MYQAANGGAKALGVIASLTVPGMENAHSASLGAGLPLPAPSDSSSPTSAELAGEAAGMESNVIRPDTNTSSSSGRLDVSRITSSNDQPEK